MQNIKQKSYWRNIYFLDNFFINQVLNNRRKFLKIFKNKLIYSTSSKILDEYLKKVLYSLKVVLGQVCPASI